MALSIASAPATVRAEPWAGPQFPTPVTESSGAIRWVTGPLPIEEDVARWRSGIPSELAPLPDRIVAWRALATHASLGPYALRRLALVHIEAGDSAAADSAWSRLAGRNTVWSWDALRARADLAVARSSPARADSILESADRTSWPDGERAAWLERRAALRAGLGDTAQSIAFSRQAIRRYPAIAVTGRTLGVLERLLAARGDSLSGEDLRAAAEVEFARGDRTRGAERLGRAAAAWPDSGRWALELRAGEMLRLGRRYPQARAVLQRAALLAPHATARARAALERARVERDAGRGTEAAAAWALAARSTSDTALIEAAWWERARAAEARGRWSAALGDYRRAAALGGARSAEASLRAALVALALGDEPQALRLSSGVPLEGARFWNALLRRRHDPEGGRAALASLAEGPGYTFYRTAARETLAIQGWHGGRVAQAGADSEGALAVARRLIQAGFSSDAVTLVDRWAAGDPRAAGPERDPGALLEGARLAYAAGRTPLGIRLAARAFEGAGDSSWQVSPWIYPPALDSLFARVLDSSGRAAGRALLRAIAWQESKFDPAARSRSDALGLFQLKRATAVEMAAMLREPAPDDRALMDPALSLRLGRAYFDRQLRRSDGGAALALAAYNAGPGAIERWRRIQRATRGRLGGDALDVELIAIPEAEDYVKRILATQRAYRELQPSGTLGTP